MSYFVLMNNSEDGTFHGGFVRDKGKQTSGTPRGVNVTLPKLIQIHHPDPITVQETSLELAGTRQYPNVKSPLKVRKTKLACLGIPSSILDVGDPAYARCVRLASSYKKARTKELYQAHGYVSSGVGALLAASGLALAASRFLYEIASSTPIQPAERGQLGMAQLLKLASGLSDSSRQSELSAWELASREAIIRKRNEQNTQSVPWLTVDAVGAEKRKAGRPRKDHLLSEHNLIIKEDSNAGTITEHTGEAEGVCEVRNGSG